MPTQRFPCIFTGETGKVAAEGVRRMGGTQYAAYQKLWRTEVCARINPYGGEYCAFRKGDCMIAYLDLVQDQLDLGTGLGWFRTEAKRRGLERSENKPHNRTDVQTKGPSDSGDVRAGRNTRPTRPFSGE
jgi:hypothetical protein